MKTITDQLFEAGKGIIERAPEVSDNTGKYEMADDGGVEVETGEFLYGLTRVMKPENIFETGTYTGISSMYMGQALKDNGSGQLITLEVDQHHKDRAEKLWTQVGVAPFITCQLISSMEYRTEQQFSIIFLDSEPEFRFKELIRFYPNLAPGGFLFIHDLHRHLSQEDNRELGFGWPYGKLPDEIVTWLKNGDLKSIHFSTPRGLSGFYKPDPRDYRP